MESSFLNFEVQDFMLYIEDFNSKLAGDQCAEVQEELLLALESFENGLKPKENGIVTYSSTGKTICSAAMTAAGLSNSTVIGAGALASWFIRSSWLGCSGCCYSNERNVECWKFSCLSINRSDGNECGI